MSPAAAKMLGGLAFLIFVSLGVGPLVQWFAFDHANGPIAALFAHPDEPWVWIWPLLVGGVAVVAMLVCGAIADDDDTGGVPRNDGA